MKKLLCILLSSLLLLSCAVLFPAAEETTGPDWIITEICPDQQGVDGNTNGYTSDVTADCFEFIEIYNNSGRELNLYDYALTYNGSGRNSEKFEHQITEYTPIKGGDYLDGSDLIPTEPTKPFGDLSNRPTNPDTCTVAPGEVVVLWMMYLEAYQGRFNDGKGMSMADFRAHWNIPDDVKVIAVDANGNTKNGGNGKNFNVKNSEVGTYGIAKQSPELEAAANAADAAGLDGNYWESEHLVCWATVDFTDMLLNSTVANVTYNFTWDFAGYAAKDQAYTYYKDVDYVYDARRCFLVTMYDEPTAGALNVAQKMTLGVELAEGESIMLDSGIMYYPLLDENIDGFKINGKFYKDDSTFTAPAAGVYTFDFFFEGDEEATDPPVEYTVSFEISGYPFDQPAPVTVTEGSCIEAPAPDLPDDGSRFDGWYTSADCNAESKFDFSTPITESITLYATLIPADTTIEAPTESPAVTDDNVVTEAPTAAPAGGCGSMLALAVLPWLAVGFVLTAKKRED